MNDGQELRTRASLGDLAALRTLGQRLLVGEGVRQSGNEGAALIREAVAKGDAEANVLLAVFTAWGVLQARNFDAALDCLMRAALAGSTPAQRELQILARSTSTDWQALRQLIDIPALTTPSAMRTASA